MQFYTIGKCARSTESIYIKIIIRECPFITNKSNDNDNSKDSEMRGLDNPVNKGVRGHCFIKTSSNLVSMDARI